METETSPSKPLPFGVLEVNSLGLLGHCGCPGSKRLDATTGPQLRDLHSDLAQLKRAGFQTFVALSSEAEYRALQLSLAELAAGCEAHGLEFIHLPQFQTATDLEAFERAWLYVGARLRYLLRRGCGVVLQEEGNRDRRRYVMARALLEQGLTLEEIQSLFSTQGLGNLANPDQVAALKKQAQALRLGLDLHRQDRQLGAFVLGALGDSLGSLVEFDRLERIRERFGKKGLDAKSLPLKLARHFGDDSQMTLFSAEAVVESLQSAQEPSAEAAEAALRLGLRRWRMSQEAGPAAANGRSGLLGEAKLWVSRKPHSTCLSALEAQGPAPFDLTKKRVDDSGALGRMLPIAVLGSRLANSLLVYSLARSAAAITHTDPLAQGPAALLAVILKELIAGQDFQTALATAINFLPATTEAQSIHQMLDASMVVDHAEALIPEVLEELSSGRSATEVLVLSLACARSASSPAMALAAAANHSGKSDTLAAVAGQLFGAHQGLGAVPAAWLAALELAPLILETAKQLADHSLWRPTPEMLSGLRKFLPLLESPPSDFVRSRDDDLIEFCEEFTTFEAALYREAWAEPHQRELQPEDFDFVLAAPELLDQASPEGLRRILMAQLRKDRAALEATIRSGFLARVVRKLTEVTAAP